MSWTCSSNEPLFHLETPTAARLLFGSPKPDCQTEERHQGRLVATFLNQPEDGEPEGDLNQEETQQLFEEDASRGFVSASHFGKSKIYLPDEASVRSSALQTVPDPQSVGVEPSSCTDMNSPCVGQSTGPLTAWEYSPGCCCRADYLSSDSHDEEEGCEECLPAYTSHMDENCADLFHLNSQRSPKLFQPQPLTPQIKSQMNFGDNQEVIETFVCPEKAFQVQQIGSSMAPSVSPHLLTQSSELCKCRKSWTETQDAGTQTVSSCTPETRDASSQTKASGFSWAQPDVSEQHPATERQSCTEPQTLPASLKKPRNEEKQAAWSKNTSKDVLKFLQRPKDSFLDALSVRGNENLEDGDGRQRENSPLMEDVSHEGREELPSGAGASALSEEVETLQEIADILLLLKQRRGQSD
ncbi:uncharacterized protein [Leuresthes tenuis]|uniref:uncharacterized protein isoform X2 n=1 Tax=Leuresthes tenuis TaxID=355514 RepID=UPI003B5083A6